MADLSDSLSATQLAQQSETETLPCKYIRNFCIIAHIDHGKSTLADRFIQLCGAVAERDMMAQVLDNLDIERERGITIKSQSVALDYQALDGQTYRLNMIDTPGHVDFSYEVSRSLAACEGALLIVDATQGVEAQSVSISYTAVEQGLTVLPVLNKMDMIAADADRVKQEIEEIIGIDTTHAHLLSARTGDGVRDLLESIIHTVPAPVADRKAPLQALIIDSWFDRYQGVCALVRVAHGILRSNEKLMVKSTATEFYAEKIGIFRPKPENVTELLAGEVGFIILGSKDVRSAPVGDTLIGTRTTEALPGFKKVECNVYAGLFPVEPDDFEHFRESLQRLSLNDASVYFEPEHSQALGPGFRCGFLGLLHMEIVRERLEREYSVELIATAPTVVYELESTDGTIMHLSNPADMPAANLIKSLREPMVYVNIITPEKYLGAMINLCISRRGTQKNMQFTGRQASLEFELPLSEVVSDFFDRLKSLSKGFASLEYSPTRYMPSNLVRLDVLLGGDRVDALSVIVHRDNVAACGRGLVERMRELIPRQMFDVSIQAAIGGKIVARQTVKALRKNVTAKCYGGDISRKRKLLEKQKSGKKRMKRLGKVEVPPAAFMAALGVRDSSTS